MRNALATIPALAGLVVVYIIFAGIVGRVAQQVTL